MVTVPTVSTPSVESKPANPNYQSASAPSGAFGASSAQALTGVGQQLGQVANLIDQNLVQEMREDNERAVKQGKLDLDASIQEINTSYLELKQEEAVSVYPKVVAEIQKAREKVVAAAMNKRVGAMLDIESQAAVQRGLAAADAHRIGERKAADKTISEAYVASKVNDYVADINSPEAPKLLDQIAAETVRISIKNGVLDPVAQSQAIKDVLSATHSAALDNLMVDNPAGANAYYNKFKVHINPVERAKIEEKLVTETQIYIAQDAVDKALELYPDDLKGGIKWLRDNLQGKAEDKALSSFMTMISALGGEEGIDTPGIQNFIDEVKAESDDPMVLQQAILAKFSGKEREKALDIAAGLRADEKSIRTESAYNITSKFLESGLTREQFAEQFPLEAAAMKADPATFKMAESYIRQANNIKLAAEKAEYDDAEETARIHIKNGGLLADLFQSSPGIKEILIRNGPKWKALELFQADTQEGLGYRETTDHKSLEEFRALPPEERAAVSLDMWKTKLTLDEAKQAKVWQESAKALVRGDERSLAPASEGRRLILSYLGGTPKKGDSAALKRLAAANDDMDVFVATYKERNAGKLPTQQELALEAQRLTIKLYTEGNVWGTNPAGIVAQAEKLTPEEQAEVRVDIDSLNPQAIQNIKKRLSSQGVPEENQTDDLIESLTAAIALGQLERINKLIQDAR